MLFIIQELPNVQIAIRIYLNPITSPLIIHKLPLVNLALLIHTDTLAPFFFLLNLPKINFPILFNQFKIIRIQQIIKCKQLLWKQSIRSKIIT